MTDNMALAVRLYGDKIGTITRIGGDRTIFAFDEAYINDEIRPTLSLSFRNQMGGLISDHRAYRQQLMPFFSNLLPEGALRSYLAKQSGLSENKEFDLLERLGIDLPGAVTVTPWDQSVADLDKADAPSVNLEANLRDKMRFSLAGVQLKFSAFENKGKGGGLTIPVGGSGGSWIVKLPSLKHEGVPENEYAMMSLARKIGIKVPVISLMKIEDIEGLPTDIGKLGTHAFAIKRFDRGKAGSVHIEDFAQVFGLYPAEKYDKASYRNILAVLGDAADQDSVTEFVRRLIFTILIANGDMHLKNWSLIYPDRITPVLSPAYDILSTLAYIPDDDSALKFVRVKRFAEFSFDELSYMAAKAKVAERPLIAAARETIDHFMTLWQAEKHHMNLAKDVIDSIDGHLKTLALLK